MHQSKTYSQTFQMSYCSHSWVLTSGQQILWKKKSELLEILFFRQQAAKPWTRILYRYKICAPSFHLQFEFWKSVDEEQRNDQFSFIRSNAWRWASPLNGHCHCLTTALSQDKSITHQTLSAAFSALREPIFKIRIATESLEHKLISMWNSWKLYS